MQEIRVRTERRTQVVDITNDVQGALDGAAGAAVLVYVPHTTAGLTINEHADPLVARDFEMALEQIASIVSSLSPPSLAKAYAPSTLVYLEGCACPR